LVTDLIASVLLGFYWVAFSILLSFIQPWWIYLHAYKYIGKNKLQEKPRLCSYHFSFSSRFFRAPRMVSGFHLRSWCSGFRTGIVYGHLSDLFLKSFTFRSNVFLKGWMSCHSNGIISFLIRV
jgi:hypothetical protein